MTKQDAKGKPRKAAKRPADVNQLAHFLGNLSTEEQKNEAAPTKAEISRVMAVLGRKGGKIGGKKRLETLTQERRSQIAFQAAQARWGKGKRRKSKLPSASPEA